MATLTIDNGLSIQNTCLQGTFTARESALRAFLGEPGEGDGYKVSREWVGHAGRVNLVPRIFTIYDWKETSLYDDELMTPDELTALDEPREWHIGGHNSSTAALVIKALRAAGVIR